MVGEDWHHLSLCPSNHALGCGTSSWGAVPSILGLSLLCNPGGLAVFYLVDICYYFLSVAVPIDSSYLFTYICLYSSLIGGKELVEPIKGGSSFQSVLLQVVLNQDINSFCLGNLSNIMTGYLLHTCYDEQTETVLGSTNTAEKELTHFFQVCIFCLSSGSGSKHVVCVPPHQWP